MGKLEINKKIKKEALFRTAFELFTTKGIPKTTISDIVEKAGVAKGTFYLYFKDKYDIRNKLISHKTAELISDALSLVPGEEAAGFEEQLLFLLDHIIARLENDVSLLAFITKNLSWGVFLGAFEEQLPEEDISIVDAFLDLMKKSGRKYDNPELMLFTIIELVSSTCYSCIIYQQPASMDTYLPYLHRSILALLSSFAVQEIAD